jgi:hypothetical protein
MAVVTEDKEDTFYFSYVLMNVIFTNRPHTYIRLQYYTGMLLYDGPWSAQEGKEREGHKNSGGKCNIDVCTKRKDGDRVTTDLMENINLHHTHAAVMQDVYSCFIRLFNATDMFLSEIY